MDFYRAFVAADQVAFVDDVETAHGWPTLDAGAACMDVITSYSIHYTKLYDCRVEFSDGRDVTGGARLSRKADQWLDGQTLSRHAL